MRKEHTHTHTHTDMRVRSRFVVHVSRTSCPQAACCCEKRRCHGDFLDGSDPSAAVQQITFILYAAYVDVKYLINTNTHSWEHGRSGTLALLSPATSQPPPEVLLPQTEDVSRRHDWCRRSSTGDRKRLNHNKHFQELSSGIRDNWRSSKVQFHSRNIIPSWWFSTFQIFRNICDWVNIPLVLTTLIFSFYYGCCRRSTQYGIMGLMERMKHREPLQTDKPASLLDLF